MRHESIKTISPADPLLRRVPHSLKVARAHRIVREPGEDVDEVIIVRTGVLSLFRDTGGHRRIVALRYPGDAILPGSPRYFGIQALKDSEIGVAQSWHMNSREALRLTQRNEAIAYEWLSVLGMHDATARIAHLLCEIAVRGGYGIGEMEIPFSQVQMADMTAQTSVNVCRVIRELEEVGLIERPSNRQIIFKDWPALQRLGGFKIDYLAGAGHE